MNYELDLNNKVIVISGGAGLLGMTYGKAITQCGAVAVLADVVSTEEFDMRLQTANFTKTDNVCQVHMDITKEDSVREVQQQIIKKYGKIDALVNNAYPRNSNYGKEFFDVTYQDFSENLSLNLGGYFVTSKIFAEYFKAQSAGNIINIASIYGVIAPRFDIYENAGFTMPVEYAAIKSGVIHLTRYMAKLLGKDNIRVNCISPGGIYDSQPEEFVAAYAKYTNRENMLDKEDIAGTLLFLLSDLSKDITGQNIVVDAGFTL